MNTKLPTKDELKVMRYATVAEREAYFKAASQFVNATEILASMLAVGALDRENGIAAAYSAIYCVAELSANKDGLTLRDWSKAVDENPGSKTVY